VTEEPEQEVGIDELSLGGLRPSTISDPGWVARERYQLSSISFTVYSTDQAIADTIRWHLDRFRLSGEGPTDYSVETYVLDEDRERVPPLVSCFVGGVLKFKSDFPPDIVAAALGGMYEAVPAVVRDFLLLHAGAVVRDGGALLLPARPDSGKSTGTLALLRTGLFEYLSDEHGAIDPVTARAYPFERPIRVDPDTLKFFDGLDARLVDRTEVPVQQYWRFVRPEDVGAVVSGPASVRWIVFPTPDWEGPPRLSALSSAEAVTEMCKNCFNLPVFQERGVYLLGRLAKEAQAYRLIGGTPEERAALLVERLV
jgi:hypothetical protein